MSAWDDIIGHEWAVEMLKGAIAHSRVGHAYLFTGPDQIGKTTLARTFAQALICTAAPHERPCGRCRACTLTANDRHPDARLVMGEVSDRGRLMLKIEQIRALQSDLNLATVEAPYKIAILRRFDAANVNAANAFLKMLEEPPASVVLLLTAANAEMLLPTIVSRCRALALRPLPTTVIADALQTRWQALPEQARLLAHLAAGRLGWAVQAAGDPRLLETRQATLETLHAALSGTRVGRFALAEQLSRDPEVLPPLLHTWASWWRDVLLLTQGGNGAELTNVDRLAEMETLARTWPAARIQASLKQTTQALWQLEHNANTRLAMENLFLVYPFFSSGEPTL